MADRRDTKNRILQKGEYQKADGRYMYKYTDINGESRFVYSWTLTASDRPPKGKHSEKCLREMEREIAKDLQNEIDAYTSKKTTLNALYERRMEQSVGLKSTTRITYKYLYEAYIRDDIGKKKLSDIRNSDIEALYSRLFLEVGLKPNTLGILNGVLHSLFCIAIRDKCINSNPLDGVIAELKRRHNWDKAKRHALAIDEQTAFIEFIKEHKTYSHWLPLFTAFLGTGCRMGELTGLTWNDCDFKNEVISINHTLGYRPDESTNMSRFYISTPKTKSGERSIPMLSAVKKALLDERVRQMKDGVSQITIDGYSGFVFTNRDGKPFIPISVNSAITRIVRDYNIAESELAKAQNREPLLLPRFTAHNLRHTFCTRLCENESNLKVIQEIMGHSNISTTMEVYNEATLDKKKESFANLEGKMKIC